AGHLDAVLVAAAVGGRAHVGRYLPMAATIWSTAPHGNARAQDESTPCSSNSARSLRRGRRERDVEWRRSCTGPCSVNLQRLINVRGHDQCPRPLACPGLDCEAS